MSAAAIVLGGRCGTAEVACAEQEFAELMGRSASTGLALSTYEADPKRPGACICGLPQPETDEREALMQLVRWTATRIIAVAGAVALAVGIGAAPSSAQVDATRVGNSADAISTTGPYFLQNVNSGLCLNVSGGSMANGAKLIQYYCYDNGFPNNQIYKNNQWYLDYDQGVYYIRSASSGLCVNVSGASTMDGAQVIQYSCVRTFNNQWVFTSDRMVENVNSWKCLNVFGGSTAAGGNVIQYTCVDHNANRWELVHV
jgi:hypothetical protein